MEYYKLNDPDVSCQIFDNEVLTINLKSGNYHSLRDTAAIVFRLLEGGLSVEVAFNKLTSHYVGIDNVKLKREFDNLISEFLKEEILVKVHEAPLEKSTDWIELSDKMYKTPILETYNDMQDLLLLDPIHDVDVKKGWPNKK